MKPRRLSLVSVWVFGSPESPANHPDWGLTPPSCWISRRDWTRGALPLGWTASRVPIPARSGVTNPILRDTAAFARRATIGQHRVDSTSGHRSASAFLLFVLGPPYPRLPKVGPNAPSNADNRSPEVWRPPQDPPSRGACPHAAWGLGETGEGDLETPVRSTSGPCRGPCGRSEARSACA